MSAATTEETTRSNEDRTPSDERRTPSEEESLRFDEARAEAFADRFLGAINGAGLMLMVSIGHRTGLFDTMRGMGPATSDEVAAEAGLQERYVREWLAALAVGEFVELDEEDRYHLPPEHAAFLTRAAEPDNFAVFAQYIPVLGAVEDEVVECFHEGGGVPYEEFPRFHAVMAEDSAQTVLSSLEDHILPLVPGLPGRLREGIRWLDAGCGRGRALLRLAERYRESRFRGYDLSDEAIAWARGETRRRGLENVRFETRDLSDFDESAEPDAFDVVSTFDAVHDQPRPHALLAGIARTLRPDGTYLMQDIRASTDVRGNMDHPLGPVLYAVSTMHCMTVSLAQGGEGLGTMWGREKARRYLDDAGFVDVELHELDHDIQNDYWVARVA